ncbi:MAG: TIGR02281 family clan AA aspartic protease [Caulobacterales bacterium]
MADHQGPWSDPPPPPPTPRRLRLRPGVFVWLGLLVGAALVFWLLTLLFPGQLAGNDWADALRIFGLLALVSSGLVAARTIRVRETFRYIAIWAAIFAAVLVGYSFRTELLGVAQRVRAELVPAAGVVTAPRQIVLTRSDDGHFYAMGEVDGQAVRFMVDTGASDVVLSPADARRVGVDVSHLDFSHAYGTANGVGLGATVVARDLGVGPIRLSNLPVSVNAAPMASSLLGMTFLRRLDSFEARGDQLVLRGRG